LNNKQFPRNKILGWSGDYAVICGSTSDNLVIIDLDYRKGDKRHFQQIFAEFNKQFPRIARTYTIETPHGHHLYYKIKSGDKVPSRRLHQDSDKSKAIERLERLIVTKFPYQLKGCDILGKAGYALIPPSKGYSVLNNYPIIEVSRTTFDKIKDFFLLDTPERKTPRKPFRDILKGTIEIEDQAILSGKEEHVYWKYTYLEVWHYLKLSAQDIFPLMEKSQPNFDLP